MMGCSTPDTAIWEKYWERHSFYGINFFNTAVHEWSVNSRGESRKQLVKMVGWDGWLVKLGKRSRN